MVQLDPIIENPFGVHDHDVLAGRGAFINGHAGNKRFRELAVERKAPFEAGSYSEKRTLASEIVHIIRSLDPPGRFLKQVTVEAAEADGESLVEDIEGSWVELSDDKAIHKACQVMRDLDRPDRVGGRPKRGKAKSDEEAAKDSIAMLAETTANAEQAAKAVEEAVAATAEALEADVTQV